MSFETALLITLVLALFVLACTMANLLARITRLERFAREVLAAPRAAPVRLAGMAAPEAAQDAIRALTKGRDEARLLFVSPDCPACDDAIEAVGGWPEEARRGLFLVYRGEPPVGFAAPAGVRVAADRTALFEALAVTATPTLVEVAGGLVTGRSTGAPAAAGRDRVHEAHTAGAGDA